MRNVYPKLDAAMKECDWNEADLMKTIEVGTNRLTNLLNGRTEFTELEKSTIANWLKVEKKELFAREG